MLDDTHFMKEALRLAQDAYKAGEVPVGAVVVWNDKIIGRGSNQVEQLADSTAHAEMIAITAACNTLGAKYLMEATLYVTLEPCPMCAAAISAARIGRLYYGASDPKSGGVAQGARVFSHPQCHHVPEVYDGIAAGAAESLLKEFFTARR